MFFFDLSALVKISHLPLPDSPLGQLLHPSPFREPEAQREITCPRSHRAAALRANELQLGACRHPVQGETNPSLRLPPALGPGEIEQSLGVQGPEHSRPSRETMPTGHPSVGRSVCWRWWVGPWEPGEGGTYVR